MQVDAAVAGGFAATIRNPTAPVEVPDVLGDSPKEATLEVKNAGLVPDFAPGSGAWVKQQAPDAGKLVPRGSTVRMIVGHGPPP